MRSRKFIATTIATVGLVVAPVALEQNAAMGQVSVAEQRSAYISPTVIDFNTESSDPNGHAIVVGTVDDKEIKRVEIVDENGWVYEKGRVGKLDLSPLDRYGDSGKHGFFVNLYSERSREESEQTIHLRVTFTDDSSEDLTEVIRYRPYFYPICGSIEFDTSQIEAGKTNVIELSGLPVDWPVRVTESRPGGARINESGSLELQVPADAYPLEVEFAYPCLEEPEREVRAGHHFYVPKKKPDSPSADDQSSAKATSSETVPSEVSVGPVRDKPGTIETVIREVPTTVVSTVPVTTTVTAEPEAEAEASSSRALPIVTVVLALIAAIGGIAATLLNIPAVRDNLPF